MRLGARKARHLDVSEVIVFGVIRSPSLDVVAGVGAAVEERWHRLSLRNLGVVSVQSTVPTFILC
jgi:hypothetical protein